jgi:hypothetical protein
MYSFPSGRTGFYYKQLHFPGADSNEWHLLPGRPPTALRNAVVIGSWDGLSLFLLLFNIFS